MRFTETFDEQKMIKDHAGMCLAFGAEALLEAMVRKVTFDINPKTYVVDHFAGIQPTKDEFLNFLEEKGFNAKAIEAKVFRQIQDTKKLVQKDQEDAEAFFKIFKTEWFVTDEQVKKYVNGQSIYYFLELVVANAASTKARLLATKRHAETRAIKLEIFTWLDINSRKFKSMDATAQAIIKQQPIAFRTARDWVGEWKKVRSAGTP